MANHKAKATYAVCDEVAVQEYLAFMQVRPLDVKDSLHYIPTSLQRFPQQHFEVYLENDGKQIWQQKTEHLRDLGSQVPRRDAAGLA